MKKVSVIVPIYNVEKYLNKCIDSILAQTYENLEIILVNDGSLQNEDEIVRYYLNRESENKIKYIRKSKNEGLFKARITGLKNATGDYVEFVDSDDWIDPDFVRCLIKRIEKDDADIAYSSTVICDIDGKNNVLPLMDTIFYKFPLSGDVIRHEYYSQEGTAYSWHTMWNKIYKKDLWVKCMPIFEKIDTHLVMLEDFLFSSVLLYYAEKLTYDKNAVYYYCQHKGASTGLGNIEYETFKKNIKDIKTVFDSLDSFFEDKESWIRGNIYHVRQMYARTYNKSIERVDLIYHEKCSELVKALCDDKGETTVFGDGYFYTVSTEFNDTLVAIKNRIKDGDERYISFDVFETAVKRPFFNPTDIFYLLDREFENLFVCNSSFHTIRMDGEKGCRAAENYEDVTIDEIYDYIEKKYYIPHDTCMTLLQREKELELEFNTKRNLIYELYLYSMHLGKNIVFISDMYLDEETVGNILRKNGYTNYSRLFLSSKYRHIKQNGGLFRNALDELGIDANNMVHIGDSIQSDYEGAKQCGIEPIHIPNCIEAFRKNSVLDEKRSAIDGYGCMVQTIANTYFDNPFRSYHPLSKYGVDPFFMGLFPLGMNIAAQIMALDKIISKRPNSRVVFTSRDGYLLKRAYDDYLKISKRSVRTIYKYTSRKSMLPVLLDKTTDFLNLPIVCYQYNPRMICELLNFCLIEDFEVVLDSYKLGKDRKFKNMSAYHEFMHFFMDNIYDKNKHLYAKEIVGEYWNDITDDDVIYDMGYSASIHNSIVKASGKNPVALFVHTDREKHMHFSRVSEFEIETIMDTIPKVSGLIREYFYSEQAPSCVSYERNVNRKVTPIFETYEKRYTDLYPLNLIHQGALQFNYIFWNIFARYKDYLDFRLEDILRPFEIFLGNLPSIDFKAFSASYFEDKVYGGAEALNVRLFWRQHLSNIGSDVYADPAKEIEELKNVYGKSKVAFWGTGRICRDLLTKNPDIKIDFFLDNSEEKDGTYLDGVMIVKPRKLADFGDTLIIIACAMYLEIGAQLEKSGFRQYKDYITYMDVF